MFEVRSLRTSVLNALFYIVENERLNEEFRLGDKLSRAINFVYHARKGGAIPLTTKFVPLPSRQSCLNIPCQT